MRQKTICMLMTAVVLLGSLVIPTPVQALTQTIYADSLAQGWEDWSWTTVNFAAAAPVHAGSKSIAVNFGAWQGVTLHKAGVDTLGYSHLRFFIHGGSSGGQHMILYFNIVVSGSPQEGPSFNVPLPPANSWVEVSIPIQTLNPTAALITGITWQGSKNSSQPVFYLDDISLVNAENPSGPQLSAGKLTPRSLPADGATYAVVRAAVSDPQGAGDIASVRMDGSIFGRGTISLRDDGRSNDAAANDGIFGAAFSIPPGTPAGDKRLLVTATDLAGHTSSLPLGTLNVVGTPGGSIPAGLPQRIGWGTNEWSETAGQDWQVNSAVPWDYVYQYITWDWETWGGSFVSRFVNQAWNKNYIPMVTVYLMLGVPPSCGETPQCYAQKLQDPSMVQAYLASLRRAVVEAKGTKKVIFNIEPDFYGFMQQLSNTSGRPAGVIPNDPTSYPVALNINGYANNLAGFGRYLVDMIHSAAPNALVAPMASMWALNDNPNAVTADEAGAMGRSTAAFIDAMGGTQSDLLIVEWSDRDAGSGLREWWDDTDMDLPRPTRAILWENALSQAANKRLLLWQVPVGNMSLNNTCDHYRDNRAAYLFNHPRDLMDAGVIGVLFGGGATCMTSAGTDNGFVAAQGGIAYQVPDAPTGLSAGSLIGEMSAGLRWNESPDADLWKYRVHYRLLPGGPDNTLEVSRRNSAQLLLPHAGTWQIQISAVDAMGKESALSAAVQATATADARHVFIPRVSR